MKALLINGSPHKSGCTYTALNAVAEALNANGTETEIFQIPVKPVSGCIDCGACLRLRNNRCAIEDDAVNIILEKMKTADALVLGSPVYYASPAGQLLAILDRVFFAGDRGNFENKPAAVVCSARRAGTTATLDVLMKYFIISGMPVIPSTYWPMVHGKAAEEVLSDKEGLQTMKALGQNMAWLLQCIDAGRKAGIKAPCIPGDEKVWTNFIR
ncbi:MAG: flavodoxin family protein [Clostridiales Family XIII bacterium]|nr:flavodoxin family protein [Clostridiales Family XIII bacterium]